jgi:hypothetical protein
MGREDSSVTGRDQLVEELRRVRAELARVVDERDEARAWARAEYHQMWDAPYLPDNAPPWLTAPM